MVSLKLSALAGTMLSAMTLAMQMQTNLLPTFTLRTVQQFSNFTWAENMAMRSNGQILATNLEGGDVFLVDPKKPPNTTPPILASFGKTTAMTGIVEVEDDVFYAAGIRDSDAINLKFGANSSTVWEIDMRKYDKQGKAAVKKIADTPDIAGPNGMTLLSKSSGLILIADAGLGKVWRFNVKNGKHEVVIENDLFKPIKGSAAEFGINGITLVKSKLYFSNTNQGILGTIDISSDGTAKSCPQIITNRVPNADDFAVAPDGSVWLAENQSNALVRVFPDGNILVVATGQSVTSQPVSARFGRTSADKHLLYISTDGLSFAADGKTPLTTNGRILALDMGKLHGNWRA